MHAVTKLVEVGSIPDWVIGFFIDSFILLHYGPGVDSASNKDISRWVRLTTLPSSCADFPEILEASTSWGPMDLSRPVIGELNKTFEALNQSLYIKYHYNKKNATYPNNSYSIIYIQSGIK
jgi:hypothetical protein